MDEAKELGEARSWFAEKHIEGLIKAINSNNMTGIYAKDRQDALYEILKIIPKRATVSHGGSYTLTELKIGEILQKEGFRYSKPIRAGRAMNSLQTKKSWLKDFSCDVYLTSVNAVTLKGELIVLDAFGNRAACMLFGPGKVIVVAGKNKIVENLESGIERIKTYVAPIHARRRGWDVPCAKTAKCTDCRSQERICNKLAVLQRETEENRVVVIIVGEDLGI